MDLTLVPFDDLMDELEKRCVTFICAFETYHDRGTTKEIKFKYGKGVWHDAVRLASILNNDVLNNWNNELRTLQRINEEENKEEG